jgi:HK97 family phage prohead protease
MDKIRKSLTKSTIKDVDEKGRVVVAANAFGNVDSDKDISEQGSYDKTIKEFFHRVKWFYNHNQTQLLGVPIEAKESYPFLEVTGQLNMKKQLSKDVYEDYKLYAEHGRTLEHSVMVAAVKFDYNNETGIRRVFEWKWWEYSTLSSWGANENTPLLDIKNIKTVDDIIVELDFLDKALKANYTDERLEQIENTMKNLRSLVGEPGKPLEKSDEPIDYDNLINTLKF